MIGEFPYTTQTGKHLRVKIPVNSPNESIGVIVDDDTKEEIFKVDFKYAQEVQEVWINLFAQFKLGKLAK